MGIASKFLGANSREGKAESRIRAEVRVVSAGRVKAW